MGNGEESLVFEKASGQLSDRQESRVQDGGKDHVPPNESRVTCIARVPTPAERWTCEATMGG